METRTIRTILEYLRALHSGTANLNELIEKYKKATNIEENNKRDIANAIGIGRLEGKRRGWTDEEIEFVKSNYKKLTLKEIAKRLNKSIYSVNVLVYRKLKLNKAKKELEKGL